MEYVAITLRRPIQIERIVSVHYFEYGPDYAFVGEQHDFWELVYVDKGEIIATAGEQERLLKIWIMANIVRTAMILIGKQSKDRAVKLIITTKHY